MLDLSAWSGTSACLAVDVPSGLDATTGEAADGVLSADATVTFHGYRVGHLIGSGPDVCGEVTVADIGLPDVEPEMWLCEEVDAPLPVRARTAHKWSAGSVLVVGGSDGLDGAATLTARAALRAGAGAVMIACPLTVEEKVRSPEIMTRAIGDGPLVLGLPTCPPGTPVGRTVSTWSSSDRASVRLPTWAISSAGFSEAGTVLWWPTLTPSTLWTGRRTW